MNARHRSGAPGERERPRMDVLDDHFGRTCDRRDGTRAGYEEEQQGAHYGRTYSNFSGRPLMPLAGGAIQLAILPGS